MSKQSVRLIDGQGRTIATADVAVEGDRLGGPIDLGNMPASVRALFDEFEEIVNGQMLSFLDDIQTRISALDIHAVFGNNEGLVEDLQVYPSQSEVSFKLAGSKATPSTANGLVAQPLPQHTAR